MSFKLFKSLLFKATIIENKIESERSRRFPNWMRLLKLKKLRLMIKDRLHEIARQNAYRHHAQQLRPVLVTRNRKR